MEKFLTADEVGALLKLHVQTVYDMARRSDTNKKIPSIRIGSRLRFREADIKEWLEKRNGGQQ